ncbi:MAG: orotidine-5'-phosphate decarboxylase [Chloroflexaceae bacterium]|nr:orotidine-5'-phosphate decarboxylase [Chloroflexaceae bacterium]
MHTPEPNPADRILVALDVPTLPAALALVEQLRGRVGGFKVGLELCTAVGVPRVVEAIGAAGGSLFLDLKLKDIPNTVAATVHTIAASYGQYVRLLTLHCDGGTAMLQAAAEANASALQLVGVTVLTSMSEATLHNELGIPDPLERHVVRLARLAQAAGLAGVVASPHEVAAIRQACGPDLLIITPGVRPAWASTGDQQRITTPAQAIQSGADYLVIGRPITAAPAEIGGPVAAVERIIAELAAASK